MPNVSDVGNAGIEQLNNAATQHEENIVIDLSSDRLIKWIGVYLVLAIGFVLKIAEVIDNNLSCLPANFSKEIDDHLLSYATSYCWEVSQNSNLSYCFVNSTRSIELLENPRLLKEFVQWLPYLMLFQAFAFALPWSYWHFRMGARLVGHLKFMQLLLNTIFEQLKEIDVVSYLKRPYDKESRNFDGTLIYKSEIKKSKKTSSAQAPRQISSASPSVAVPVDDDSSTSKSSLLKWFSKSKKTSPPGIPPIQENKETNNSPAISMSFLDRFVVGDMTDRHFFSMLCYENFASMPHIPYILSVFELTRAMGKYEEPIVAEYFLNQGMLYLWCHQDNLRNILLVKRYMYKNLATAVIALLMLALFILFGVMAYEDAASSETFACLVFDEICMICSIQQKRDFFAVFLIDVIILSSIAFLSLRSWYNVRSNSDKVMCHFFDQLNETANIAIVLAKDAIEEKNK